MSNLALAVMLALPLAAQSQRGEIVAHSMTDDASGFVEDRHLWKYEPVGMKKQDHLAQSSRYGFDAVKRNLKERLAVSRTSQRHGSEYVWIPPGKFVMGCSPGDTECFNWEEAPHSVAVAKGFWIGRTEVTQQAWQRVVGTNPSRYRHPTFPVDQMSWFDARAYCEQVGMRLPTAQEWEYAARAGNTNGRYGDPGAVAWFDGNSGDSTHEVASKLPNGFGLYDMLGNVWEWVQDDYPPSDHAKRLLRGGSFVNLAGELRASSFLWAVPDTAHRNMGVRCAGSH